MKLLGHFGRAVFGGGSVQLHSHALDRLKWTVVVHSSGRPIKAPVIFANLNQLGHAGALGVVLAMNQVWPKEEPAFIVNLGWKLFPIFGWVSKWRYSEF